MREITLHVSGSTARASSYLAGVQGEGNATDVIIRFDPSWDGYAKKIVWCNAMEENPVVRTLTADLLIDLAEGTREYKTAIPPEPLEFAGECTMMIDGYLDGRRARSVPVRLKVEAAPPSDGAREPADPTPSQAEQLMAAIDGMLSQVEEAKEAAEDATKDVASAVSKAEEAVSKAEEAVSKAGSSEDTKRLFLCIGILRDIIENGVYTGDVSALLVSLDDALENEGTGDDPDTPVVPPDEPDEPDEPDVPVVPPDEPEVTTEMLTPVFAQNYPDRKTFAYTEVTGSAVDNFYSYIVFKRSDVRGGVLQIDLDTTRWTGYRALIYVFDSTGAPYLHLAMSGTGFITDPIITANQYVSINEIGNTSGGWIHINLPSVTYEVPAGCSVMVCINGVAGTSTEILDESLIMDTPTGKRYKLYDAIVAGEVLTAKVVGGVSNG